MHRGPTLSKRQPNFNILAGFVGLVMGWYSIVCLDRHTLNYFPQTKDHASYFSFYDVVEKLGIVIGTFLFGAIEGYTESMRKLRISVTLILFNRWESYCSL